VASHVAELINKWNSNKNGAVYRDRLQDYLNWDSDLDKGLGDLVEEYFKTQFYSSGSNRITPEVNSTPRRTLSPRIDYKKMWSLIEDRTGRASEVVQPILDSGWNFEDIREEGKGRFDRAPDLNEGFLRDMLSDDPYIDEMSQSQIGLLTALFKAWRYWHRRQSEGG
jgi:hypothetical protein